jgi:hypothetical protein
MGRYSENPSYDHRICRIAHDCFKISWVCDRYYSGSRLRFPRVTSRITDERGARRFAKRWTLLCYWNAE